MNEDIKTRIAEIYKRAMAASVGPLGTLKQSHVVHVDDAAAIALCKEKGTTAGSDTHLRVFASFGSYSKREADADLFASAREDILWLLEQVDRLGLQAEEAEARLQDMRKSLDEWCNRAARIGMVRWRLEQELASIREESRDFIRSIPSWTSEKKT
jgi:hypothetical protein